MKIKSLFLLLLITVSICSGFVDISNFVKPQPPKVQPVIPYDSEEEHIEYIIKNMTIEEKVAQLFIVLPEAIFDNIQCVTAAGEATKEAINKKPVGGFIYLSNNLKNPEQVRDMLKNIKDYSNERSGFAPFLCVDEEGGTVARIGNNPNFHVPSIENMQEIGNNNDLTRATEAGKIIGNYLYELGFNVDFAPVADVLSNPYNQIVYKRSFGKEPKTVASLSAAFATGLQSQNICAAYKHFPGHGATEGDTHEGYAYTNRNLEELRNCELIPFQTGTALKIPFIMVAHISLPNILKDNTPASLSKVIITDVLRNEIGYHGIIITDAMNMGAIAQHYSSDQAAVKAFEAGADIILMPDDYNLAYKGILDAVKNGTITENRLNDSLRRILKIKLSLN